MKVAPISFLSIFMLLWSFSAAAQQDLPPPELMALDNPPPPGLIVPIDFGIPGVMAGGLFIGIYFLRNRKATVSNP